VKTVIKYCNTTYRRPVDNCRVR